MGGKEVLNLISSAIDKFVSFGYSLFGVEACESAQCL